MDDRFHNAAEIVKEWQRNTLNTFIKGYEILVNRRIYSSDWNCAALSYVVLIYSAKAMRFCLIISQVRYMWDYDFCRPASLCCHIDTCEYHKELKCVCNDLKHDSFDGSLDTKGYRPPFAHQELSIQQIDRFIVWLKGDIFPQYDFPDEDKLKIKREIATALYRRAQGEFYRYARFLDYLPTGVARIIFDYLFHLDSD